VNTANAVTQKYFRKQLVDAWANPSPTWWRLTRLGIKQDGAASIVVPISAAEETTGGAYWGANVLDTTIVDSVQPAEWQWKHYYQSIVVPYTDVLFNGGETKVLDLIKVKEEVAMASLLQKLSRAAYDVTPQNTSLDMDSLVDGVGSFTNTYAGIDRSVAANAFWKPGGSAGAAVAEGGPLELSTMQTAYGNVTFGNEEPGTILTTQAIFNQYWNLLVPRIQYERDEETTRMGFKRHLMLNNAVVLHDFFVPAQTAYVLNEKYICLYFLDKDYFVIDPFIRPSNQRVLISGIFVTLNLAILNPRMHTVITGITG
jgi:hypothetical protein